MQLPTVEFYRSVHQLENLPTEGYPEIAFAGRSNVGKSTLLNTLAHRKAVAKVSTTPGKTRAINYFNAGAHLFFVDLPGYGFARVSQEERQKWQALIEGYFRANRRITLLLHLVDCRHGMTRIDYQLAEWLDTERIPVVVIGTKSDKLKRNERQRMLNQLQADAVHAEAVYLYSAKEAKTVTAVWKLIQTYIPKT